MGPPRKRSKRSPRVPDGISGQVAQLASELEGMKALLESLRGKRGAGMSGDPDQGHSVGSGVSALEDDAISLAASGTDFRDQFDSGSLLSEAGSRISSGSQSEEDGSVVGALRTALARLHLDAPQDQPAASSAFFRRPTARASFMVPPSAEYVKELHACWTDTKAFSRLTSDGRALAAMHNAPSLGLGHMPSVEPAIASLIVAPDEALRANARCPRPQCRVTDDLLCRAYDSGSRLGRLGNSLSHLLLGLSASLEDVAIDAPTQGLMDASLHAFALLSREVGRVLSTLVQARRQVWLAQSPLTEACRRTLMGLPVVPGELFGSAALAALERSAEASRTRQQLAGLHRRRAQRPTRSASVSLSYTYPARTTPCLGQPRFAAGPAARPAHGHCDPQRGRANVAPQPGRATQQPSRPPKGRGARR